jgi:acyl carrier protein
MEAPVSSEARARELLATYVGLDRGPIADALRLREDLALDLVDLVMIARRLEEEAGSDEVPIAVLARARTVSELVELLGGWHRDTWLDVPPTLRTGTCG